MSALTETHTPAGFSDATPAGLSDATAGQGGSTTAAQVLRSGISLNPRPPATTAAQVLRSGTSAQPWFAEEWLGLNWLTNDPAKWINERNHDSERTPPKLDYTQETTTLESASS